HLAVGADDRLELLAHRIQAVLRRRRARGLDGMDDDQNEHGERDHQADGRNLLPLVGGALDLLGRKQVDADHLSPGRRVASPTTTARAGPLWSMMLRSTRPSTVTRRKGSTTSTLVSSRSFSCADSPGIRDGPPDRSTAPSGSSVAAVQKNDSA